MNVNNRTVIEVSNSLVINGNTIKTVSAVSFTSQYNLFLFANNNAGTAQLPGTLKLYSCQIYDNGTLVRDFIPCKNTDGTVGLYDKLHGLLYINLGTGAFTAGPVKKPDTPENFTAVISNGVVYLSWATSSGATGYRLYRDGTLLADQTGTGYTDNIGAAGEYSYTLIAYNDDGDSPAATLKVTVVLPPSAPAELRIPARTRTTISIAWDAVSGAEGYRLYRDGVQIYGGTAASYTDTGLSTKTPYIYAVEAFNSAGTSSRITLETATTGLILITDRTQQDVDRVRELAGKLNAGTATVEELAEWNSIALKGSYDHTDLNRVGDAVQYLSEILKSLGYHCPVNPKLDWLESGSGSPSDMAQYLQNVQTLRGILTLLNDTPNVPADMDKPTWQEANAIEQILADLESTIKTMLKTRVVCGDAYCGGEYL